MKYVFLLVILCLIGFGLYYAGTEYDSFFLITSHWEIGKEDIENGWLLVSIKDSVTNYYGFSTANGFTNIAKEFWLIGVLFVGTIALLLPLSIYLLKTMWNQHLSDAKQSVIDANAKVELINMETLRTINMMEEKCDLKIKSAFDEQLEQVKKRLSERLKMIEFREEKIEGREIVAENKKREAEENLSMYRSDFQKLKLDFERKEKLFTKSRNNAVAAMNRRKKKHNTKVTV
jgi:hypothetical protein